VAGERQFGLETGFSGEVEAAVRSRVSIPEESVRFTRKSRLDAEERARREQAEQRQAALERLRRLAAEDARRASHRPTLTDPSRMP
jgi:hypothetical protein